MNAFSSLASSSPSGSTVQSEPPLRQGPLGAIRSMFSDADGDIANGSSPAVESVSSSASNNKWNASGVKNMFTGGGKLSTDDSAPAVDEGGDNDGFFFSTELSGTANGVRGLLHCRLRYYVFLLFPLCAPT
mmetsp:Transcript_41562/g.97265  ORF Transcript_41562/g.97265 Transcript_41562/m.97265 type:complete len:131 (-) Transcript_41562:725-1117(-)